MKNLTFYLLIAVLFGCRSQVPDAHNHEGETAVTDAHTIRVTLYADNLELFMEHGPLVLHEETGFLAHLTRTDSGYLPLEGARVILRIDQDGQSFEHSFEPQEAAGIYRTACTPSREGVATLSVEVLFRGLLVSFAPESVPVYHGEHDVPAFEEDPGGTILFTKEQAWKSDFCVVPVVRKPFHPVIRTSGQVLPARGDERMVAATAAGIVAAGSADLLTGARVTQGQWLFSLVPGDLSDENLHTRIALAKTTLDKAQADYRRTEELAGEGILSQKSLLEAKTAMEEASTRYESLTRNVISGGKQILCPISGFLKTVYVHEGDYVTVGEPLAMVSQNRRLVLKADVSPKYTTDLPRITSARFKTLYNNRSFTMEQLGGKVITFGKSVDVHTFYTPVLFEFDNLFEIIPGSFCEVYLKLSPGTEALVIPLSALTEEAGVHYVYVQKDGERFEKRNVLTGGDDGTETMVLSGLEEGERIVARGAMLVKMASLSAAIPHGHTH